MSMRNVILSSLSIVMLFTMNSVWADQLPSPTSIQVEVLDESYSYRASDGTTIALGEIQNNLGSPINDVSVSVIFMNDNSDPLETVTGTTLLQVIPPGGKAPFMISSNKADPAITNFQVKLTGFRAAADRPLSLDISPGPLQVSDKTIISGTITNNGVQNSTNTKLYLISYDPFQRVVAMGISNTINVDAGKYSQFSITSDSNSRAKSYMLIAESDNYQSKLTPANVIQMSLPVSPYNTRITDSNGISLSTIPVNTLAKITSTTKYSLNSTQPFIYYVQVKQFSGQTEFIGQYEGVFLGYGNQNATVNWTPHTPGSYFVETYVWNYDFVPLSAAVPSINLVLVK